MVSAWWLVVAFWAGSGIGVLLAALGAMSGSSEEADARRRRKQASRAPRFSASTRDLGRVQFPGG